MPAFTRRRFLAASGAFALAGCATRPLGVPDATQVPPPDWKVGDTWVYRRTDAYTGLDAGSPVTRRVTEAGPNAIHVPVTTAAGTFVSDTVFANPSAMLSGTLSGFGPMTGRFVPPLRYYDFPLFSGKKWGQQLNRVDAGGFDNFMTLAASVEGWETFAVAGRKLRAIAIRRYFMLGLLPMGLGLDMGNSFRWDLEWYAPEIGGFVSLDQQERYQPNRFQIMSDAPSDWYRYELRSFQRTEDTGQRTEG